MKTDKNKLPNLTQKIILKQNSGMDVKKDSEMLINELREKASKIPSLASALGMDTDASKELAEYVGEHMNFPLKDLEETLAYARAVAELLEDEFNLKEDDSKSIGRQKLILDRIAAVQWHFNNVSKTLTSEYLTTNKVTTYGLISPYIGVNMDMAKEELKNYYKILEEADKALKDKDMKALYKCNADLMCVSTNLIQYRYFLEDLGSR